MPTFKKILSNIKPRPGKDAVDGPPLEPPILKRSMAGRLKKPPRPVHQGLELISDGPPVVKIQRQATQTSVESVAEFDAELRASISRPINRYALPSRRRNAQPDSLVSKYGLTIDTDAINRRPKRPESEIASSSSSSVAQANVNLRDELDDPLGNWPIWLNSRTNTDSSDDQGVSSSSSSRPSASKYSSTDNISRPHSQVQPQTPDTARSSFHEQDAAAASCSKRRGKQKLPSISNIDWSQIGEDEALEIAQAYGASNGGRGVRNEDATLNNEALPVVKSRWLNGQDFSKELEDFKINEEAERADRELNELLARLQAEEEATIREQERQAAEEIARILAEEEAAIQERERLAAEETARLLAEEEAAAEAARIAEEMARLRECMVCGDAKDPLEYSANAPTARCEHPPQTCKECIESWMASEFETKGTDNIKCPECDQTLDYNEVQQSASTETFEKFDKMAMRNALGGLDEFAWCLKADCGSGQMNVDNNSFMDCASCGYKQCLTHKVPWHNGETCEAYDYRVSGQQQKDEERKTEEMLDQVSKKCPNKVCGWRIQKTSGCEHMTCKKCKHEFCWLCLAAHSEIKRIGNTAHAVDCKFHSDNLEIAWPFNAH